MDVATIGKETARAMSRLLKQGVPVEGVHFVGHSLGAHVLAYAARSLAARGFKIPRLTGLDPAYPGFYPPILGQPVSKADATFVDIIHTDGGGYGAPGKTGHADFWPNGGHAKQPGCLSATVLLTDEDFCSHWRSWAFWAESVGGGEFLARRCASYDSFLRGQCQGAPLVHMGLEAAPGYVTFRPLSSKLSTISALKRRWHGASLLATSQ
ncbi:Vitellogenin [Operophtera brumata]|uniref:Vitellogenin n=1 Tax=Operophtera brumata TaxID=104452 RepID=A0A0L7LUS6_OPEBR|nr:Vitellogenin [Operophtera brumata]